MSQVCRTYWLSEWKDYVLAKRTARMKKWTELRMGLRRYAVCLRKPSENWPDSTPRASLVTQVHRSATRQFIRRECGTSRYYLQAMTGTSAFQAAVRGNDNIVYASLLFAETFYRLETWQKPTTPQNASYRSAYGWMLFFCGKNSKKGDDLKTNTAGCAHCTSKTSSQTSG